MAKNTEPEMKTYFVQRKGGRDQRVTVPAHWKVTFGPLMPGKHTNGGEIPALRFYESANQQRMVITEVICFRDASIKVEEKRTSVKQQMMRRATSHGDKEVAVEARVEEWVNPDAPESGKAGQEFFLLTEESNDG